MLQAFCAEAIGTAFLGFFVFAVTDDRNSGRPSGSIVPVLIGLAVAIIISIIAPLTQAGFNPARDFGPRLFAYLMGWDSIAIPGSRGGFLTVYILAPVIGGLVGATLYQYAIRWKSEDIIPSEKRDINMSKPRVILVGGFLGAGKTTLLRYVAQQLKKQNKRVGLVTNDQAPQLVDTKFLQDASLAVKEVAGGCFCCKFSEFEDALSDFVSESDSDILLGEPVGSCTDLSATVIQPLKDKYGGRFTVAPYAVLVDPERASAIIGEAEDSVLHPSAQYILKKQLEEADVILLNKIDLLSNHRLSILLNRLATDFPKVKIIPISARTGNGVDEWLDIVLRDERAGLTITDVDYDIYAEGEAVLGWVNCTALLNEGSLGDARDFCNDLLQTLHRSLNESNAQIAHVKILLEGDGEHSVKASLTSSRGRGLVDGDTWLAAAPLVLTLNARVQTSPEELERAVRSVLSTFACGNLKIQAVHSLSPGRPVPTHRYKEVVGAR